MPRSLPLQRSSTSLYPHQKRCDCVPRAHCIRYRSDIRPLKGRTSTAPNVEGRALRASNARPIVGCVAGGMASTDNAPIIGLTLEGGEACALATAAGGSRSARRPTERSRSRLSRTDSRRGRENAQLAPVPACWCRRKPGRLHNYTEFDIVLAEFINRRSWQRPLHLGLH